MPYDVTNPYLDEPAGGEVAQAVGSAIAFGLGTAIGLNAVKYGAKGAWHVAKGSAQVGYEAATGLGKAARYIATNKAMQTGAKGLAGGAVGGLGGLVGGATGAVVGTAWGATRGVASTAFSVARTGYNIISSPVGSQVALAGAAVAGVGMAATSNMRAPGMDRARPDNITDLMQDINATGNIVFGMHNRA